MAGKNHPATKVNQENFKTLRENNNADELLAVLKNFRERHYSAHRMKVVIQVSILIL